ncbi:MAG: hypothetical protein DWH99_01500 [Planctomycetota bacterium]|nr:MAG: hypothetical protein DWH99_01500 [Planctomycetota bacterium]
MGIGPFKDLFEGQIGEMGVISNTSLFSQELCQRQITRQTATAAIEGQVDVSPVFSRRILHFAAIHLGPLAEPTVMSIGPFKDLRDGQRGSWR